MWVNCTILATSQAKPFHYLLTDPRQFGILPSGPGWRGTEMQLDQLKRREFITLLGGAAAWPLAARAQQRKPMRRIGALMPYAANDPQVQARNAAFLQGLQQLGWSVGNNVQIDYLSLPKTQSI